jgi:acetoin utilization protein AcuB
MVKLTTVAHVMTPDPICITSKITIAEAHAIMSERGFRHLPVVDDKRLVGVLSTTDIGRLAIGVPELMAKPVSELMTPTPQTIDSSAPVEVAAATLAARKINCLPVTRNGELVGIITTYDLLDALARQLRTGDEQPT